MSLGTTRRQQRVLLLLGIAAIALAALDSWRFSLRLDLSANRMFSLSEVSRRIARELPEQLAITYYVSEKLGSRYPFPSQVADMLSEFAAFSRGKITVSVVDPARARRPIQPESLGLVAQQMQVVEKQEINLATVYSGIVVQYLDRLETLPFVSDLTTLEYDLCSRIRSLVDHRERVVGILLGDSRKTLQGDYRSLLQELGQQFRIQPLERGADIAPEVTVLFVIGNKDLDERDLFPVDRYIMGGGRVLFAVSPVDVDLTQGLRASTETVKATAGALAAYGVRLRDELVLDSLNQRISFRVQQNRVMVVSYPHWVAVSGRTVARDNPITARFGGLDLYWPSPLDRVDVTGVKSEALVQSSPDAWTMHEPFETNPALSQSPAVQDTGPRRQYALAFALSGSFPSFFAGKRVPVRQGEKPPEAPAASRSRDTRMVVVGNAAFASDMVQYTNAQYNLTFLSNCADWLGSDDDLLSIKTRSQVDVRLNRITDPAAKARVMAASQVISVVIVPLAVVLFGVLRFLRRRSRQAEHARDKDAP